MAALAASLGLAYVDVPTRGYREDVPAGLPWRDLPLLKQSETSGLHNLMYGSFAGQPTQAFDLDLLTYREEPRSLRRACVVFGVEASFPLITISPHTRLSLAEERDRSPFAQKYRVLGRDPEVAKLLLDEPMREWLLGVELPIRVELAFGSLLGHVGSDPDVWNELFQTMFGFFIRIPDAALARFSGR
jgi:hypothetical protein